MKLLQLTEALGQSLQADLIYFRFFKKQTHENKLLEEAHDRNASSC